MPAFDYFGHAVPFRESVGFHAHDALGDAHALAVGRRQEQKRGSVLGNQTAVHALPCGVFGGNIVIALVDLGFQGPTLKRLATQHRRLRADVDVFRRQIGKATGVDGAHGIGNHYQTHADAAYVEAREGVGVDPDYGNPIHVGRQDQDQIALASAALGILAQVHLREHVAALAFLHTEDQRQIDDIAVQIVVLLFGKLARLGLACGFRAALEHFLAQLHGNAHVQGAHLVQVAIMPVGHTAVATGLPFVVRGQLGCPHLAIDGMRRLDDAHLVGLGAPADGSNLVQQLPYGRFGIFEDRRVRAHRHPFKQLTQRLRPAMTWRYGHFESPRKIISNR